MNAQGYTLVEMLAALAIVGLAMTAAVEAVGAVGRLQRQASQGVAAAEGVAASSAELDHLLADAGPFPSAGGPVLSGDTAGFAFTCAAARCGARLGPAAGRVALQALDHGARRRFVLPVRAAGFRYIGERTAEDHWPPDNPTNWQRLKAIAIVSPPGSTPVAIARIWVDGARPEASAP